jgi:hypothetical protein
MIKALLAERSPAPALWLHLQTASVPRGRYQMLEGQSIPVTADVNRFVPAEALRLLGDW